MNDKMNKGRYRAAIPVLFGAAIWATWSIGHPPVEWFEYFLNSALIMAVGVSIGAKVYGPSYGKGDKNENND